MSAPVRLDAAFADAMARADGCPDCDNTQPPRCAVPTDAGWMASHLCADCGTAWTNDYREDV